MTTATNEVTLTPRQAGPALELCIRARQPVILRGEAGIGKSDVVAQTAARLGLALIDLRLGQLSDVDLRGLPDIDATGRTVWRVPNFLPQDGNGLLFIDELNRGLTATQNAAFQLIRDRRLGDYTLPAGWAVVAAINPEGSAASGGTTKMSQALNNRFAHLNLIPDVQDWCTWALGAGVEPVTVAFMRFRPNLLHAPSRAEYAFPSPRSWEFVSRVTAQKPSQDIELALVAGSVGYGAAIEYCSFLQTWRTLPSIDAILLNPTGSPVPRDCATQYAVASALASRANDGNLGRVIQFLERMPAEFATFAVKDAVTRQPDLTSTPEFTRWAVAHADLM